MCAKLGQAILAFLLLSGYVLNIVKCKTNSEIESLQQFIQNSEHGFNNSTAHELPAALNVKNELPAGQSSNWSLLSTLNLQIIFKIYFCTN